MGPDVNAMAAQGVAQRMGGGGPPQGGPPGMGGGPPPGMGGPPPGGMGGGNPAVEQGRQMIQQLTMLITSDPEVMAALVPDIKSFVGAIQQFAGMAQGGGQGGPQGPMPPQGPPGGGMGGPQGPPPGMGGPPPGM